MELEDIQFFYNRYPQYKEALRLVTTDGSATDIEEKRHQAREILTGILTDSEASSNSLWTAIVKSAIGCVLIAFEHMGEGERILVETIPLLEQYQHITCLQLIQSLNTLAVVHYQRGDIDTATQYLERAEALCSQHTGEGQSDPDRNEIDHCNTQTVFLLAQIYSQSCESDKAAFYCHKTLQQQISFRDSNTDFDSFEWASNCIKLSAFYVNNNRLRQARYCIDVALAILPEGQSEKDVFIKADIHCAFAEVYSRWLHLSGDLYQGEHQQSDTDFRLNNTIDEFVSVSVQIPACLQIAQTLKDAQTIFREGHLHFQSALKVYTLDGFVTDHVVLLQKASALLKDLIVFSSDHSHICKLHKRRIDLLESVTGKLNPKIYTAFVRQLLYELAECYSDMADSKLEQINQESAQCKASRFKKVNLLTAKSIQYFRQFISSLTEHGSSEVDSGSIHTFLKAKFQVARLHSRFIHSDNEPRVASLKSSLHEYEEIISLCRKRPVDEFKEELHICQEMCSLLPLKIQSLLSSDQ